VSAVPAMVKFFPRKTSSVGEIDLKIVVFAVFWPISPTKRPIDGKLLTFCEGTLGCFGFWLHAENLPSLKNQNFDFFFFLNM